MKTAGRLIGSGILLLLCGGMVMLAQRCPELIFTWYPAASKKILAAIASITSRLPVSAAELLAALAILWALYTLIRVLRGKASLISWLSGAAAGILLAVTLFLALWGLNYFNPVPLADRLGLQVSGYTLNDLYAAGQYYLSLANTLCDQVPRDENGVAQLGSFSELAEWSGEGYETLSRTLPCFDASHSLPKPTLCSPLLSYMGITGIFTAWTAEANINTQTPQASLPYTMAHEQAHAQGIGPEDECNFAAYLACSVSDRTEIQYSGAYSAFIYCYNALYQRSPSTAAELWYAMRPGLARDVASAGEHYRQYDGRVQQTAEKVNDAYLKSMQQTAGVQSYGQVVDLLIAWYLRQV